MLFIIDIYCHYLPVVTHYGPFSSPFYRHHISLPIQVLNQHCSGDTFILSPEYTRMGFFESGQVASSYPKGTDMKKKLKRKQKTYAKSVQSSRAKLSGNKKGLYFNVLKFMAFISYCLSICRSARDLGWCENLPALVEKIGVASKIIILIFKKMLKREDL
ncbi:hypothetical protein [Pectobacterium brasiliense]|uniref:hypothetical protein n=1 Tax=Pectobacterium brasiliense TaxID=180957 RepID=UPI002A80D171|nr:hypothetical protein [Pectobacterium brasiliense]MDY4348000.1 hypothetical protein [Pectobacterium brasiliense]